MRSSVWLGGLDGVCWWELDAERPIYPASLVKTVWVTAAERCAGRGELDLEVPVPVHADFASAVSGTFVLDRDDDQDDDTWAALGRSETLAELGRRAVQLSGNLAADLVREQVDHVAPGEVAAVVAEAGCGEGTRIPTGIGDLLARERGIRNSVTAHDLARLLARTPPPVEELMRGQHYRDAIPAGLARAAGEDASADASGAAYTVANKTGWVDGITHDMAVVRPSAAGGAAFVLVVLTEHDTTQEAATAHIADLAARAWERRR